MLKIKEKRSVGGCQSEPGHMEFPVLRGKVGRMREGVPGLTQPRPTSEAGGVAHVLLHCRGPGSVLGRLFECKYQSGHWVSTEIEE